MIGADAEAAWFPLLIILGSGIASVTLGALNLETWWGQMMLWFGIVEIILTVIISIFTYGNKIKL